MTTIDPLTGPFLTSTQLTTYSDTPTYPIRLRDVPEGGDCADRALSRLGFGTDDENRKAA